MSTEATAGKTYNATELAQVLDLHHKWFWGKPGGQRANLEGANLKGANLEGANLKGANLKGANLKGANLEGANLEGANLEGANLEGANLKGANLKGAYLEGANLEGAYLKGANLEGANLKGAYLEGANLEGAYLKGANLEGAYLEGDFTMPGGYLWSAFKSDVVPPLLLAGGKSFPEVVRPDVWGCNSWSNCPMHVAFDANGESEIPPLYRQQGSLFIKLFDTGHLPMAMVRENCEKWEERHGRPKPVWIDDAAVCEVPQQ